MNRYAGLALGVAALLVASPVAAASYATVALVDASAGADPFGSCATDHVADQEATFGSTLYPGAELEPWLEINPTNPNNIVAGWQQDRWSDGGSRGLVAGVSKNGGATWSRVVIPGVVNCAGGTFDRSTDPWLSFAPNGRLYFVSQAFDVFGPDQGLLVSVSNDGGTTWGNPVNATAGTPSTAPRFPFDDKVSITADPGDPSGNTAYLVWDRSVIPASWVFNKSTFEHFRFNGSKEPTLLSRTIDGGKTWSTPKAIYAPGANAFTIFSQIVVLPNGTLVDMLFEFLPFKNNDGGGKFSANIIDIRSSDKGLTWSKPSLVMRNFDVGVFDSETNTPLRTGGETIAVDRNPTSPGYGNLYAVTTEASFSNGAHDDIAFTDSTDGGLTWSPFVKVNQTPNDAPAFTPTVAVAADGTVGVGYYDLRNNTSAPGLTTDLWLAHCHSGACAGSGSWSETHVAGPFDHEQAAIAGGYFLGDYAGLGVDGTDFLPFYGVAGNAANPSDIWFARVTP